MLDCVGDAELTVAPISRLSLAANAKVGVLLPVRIGGYGSTTAVTMEVADIFPPGVEVKGVRTHFYQAVRPDCEQQDSANSPSPAFRTRWWVAPSREGSCTIRFRPGLSSRLPFDW